LYAPVGIHAQRAALAGMVWKSRKPLGWATSCGPPVTISTELWSALKIGALGSSPARRWFAGQLGVDGFTAWVFGWSASSAAVASSGMKARSRVRVMFIDGLTTPCEG
jgi:hypothetical protein